MLSLFGSIRLQTINCADSQSRSPKRPADPYTLDTLWRKVRSGEYREWRDGGNYSTQRGELRAYKT